MTALEFFKNAYDKVQETLVYDPVWSSLRTGFDFAVYRDKTPKLSYGSLVKTMSNEGQRLILIGTRFGNVVVYERFSPGKGVLPELGLNCTKYLRKGGWVRNNEPNLEDLKFLLGVEGDSCMPNIGLRIEELRRLLNAKN